MWTDIENKQDLIRMLAVEIDAAIVADRPVEIRLVQHMEEKEGKGWQTSLPTQRRTLTVTYEIAWP